ncbi:MAG: hypothetical protein QW379_00160 [Thermoplasmata archaeon]
MSLNRSSNEILVARMRPAGQVVMFEAHIYTFTCASSQSTNPTDRHREVYITEPASANSDGTLLGRRIDLANGIMDGEEPSGYEDSDNDGIVNARDIDSDDDWVQDTEEGGWGEWGTDLDGDGVCNMLDTDSDADGLNETIEYPRKGTAVPKYAPGSNESHSSAYCNPPYDPDSDDDGLLDGSDVVLLPSDYRYAYFTSSQHSIANVSNGDGNYSFFGEISHCTNWSDPDTDHDKLIDGNNRTIDGGSYYGEKSVGTWLLDPDTDNDAIIDGDEVYGWTYYYEDMDGCRLARGGHSDPRAGYTDSDSDGINDTLEFRVSHGSCNDSDFDGLNDGIEKSVGTSMVDQDSDDDYLPDGWVDFNNNSVKDYGEYEDKDLDGALDSDETSPLHNDTDSDGVEDWIEVRTIRFRTSALNGKYNVSNTWIAADIGNTSMWVYWYNRTSGPSGNYSVYLDYKTPEGYDLVLYNYTKKILWVNMSGCWTEYTINQWPWQSDIRDALIVPHPTKEFWTRENGTGLGNPRSNDSDADGLTDGQEVFELSSFDTLYLQIMNPDKDSLWNPKDGDSDNDNITDRHDLYWNQSGTWIDYWWNDFDGDGKPNALDWDSDNDTLPDGWIDFNGNSSKEVNEVEDTNLNGKYEWWIAQTPVESNPLGNDSDLDGINDTAELAWGLNKTNNDTDGDGILDGKEKNWNSDLDGDGWINARDPDSDGDGLIDGNNLTVGSGDWRHSAYLQNGTSHINNTNGTRTFFGEGWHGTSPWSADTDQDGLWDGFDLPSLIPYSGKLTLGNLTVIVENGTVCHPYRYINLTTFNITARGELSVGTEPLNCDTDNDTYTDGDEINGYFVYNILSPGDIVNGSYLWCCPIIGSWGIENNSHVSTPVPIESEGRYVIRLLAWPHTYDIGYNPSVNISLKFKGTNDTIFLNSTKINHLHTYFGIDYQTNCLGNLTIKCLGPDNVNIFMPILLLRQGIEPTNNDTDGDGLDDDIEIKSHLLTSPYWYDSDRDSIEDSSDDQPMERDPDYDGLSYPMELYYGTDFFNPDTDFDDLNDGPEILGYHTNAKNPDTDGDGLEDGIEVNGWDAILIDNLWAVFETCRAIQNNESVDFYLTYRHVKSSPLNDDTDGDCLSDFDEFYYRTDPDCYDSDKDTWVDNIDDDPAVMDIKGPTIECSLNKPAFSFSLDFIMYIEDKQGIRWVGLYREDKIDFQWCCLSYSYPTYMVLRHTYTICGGWDRITDGVKFPNFKIVAEDCYGFTEELNLAPVLGIHNTIVHYGLKWMTKFLGPIRGGLVSGFIVSMMDVAVGLAELFWKPWSLFEGIAKLSELFAEHGWGAFEEIKNSAVEKQKDCNPYNNETEESKYDQFANAFYSGYIAGMILQVIICKKIASRFGAWAKVPRSTIIDNLASKMTASEVAKKFSEWSAKWSGLRPGIRMVIVGSIEIGLAACISYAFPEIFDFWFKTGIGTPFAATSVIALAKGGILQSLINKIAALKKSFRRFAVEHPRIFRLYAGVKWSTAEYNLFLENIDNIIDMGKVSPRKFALWIEEWKNKGFSINDLYTDISILKENRVSGLSNLLDKFGEAIMNPKKTNPDGFPWEIRTFARGNLNNQPLYRKLKEISKDLPAYNTQIDGITQWDDFVEIKSGTHPSGYFTEKKGPDKLSQYQRQTNALGGINSGKKIYLFVRDIEQNYQNWYNIAKDYSNIILGKIP